MDQDKEVIAVLKDQIATLKDQIATLKETVEYLEKWYKQEKALNVILKAALYCSMVQRGNKQ